MRKKILYGILFLTLFITSTVSMIQPVYAYEIGMPDEAIDLVQEAEIKIYNEDAWEDSIGKKGLTPDDIYLGDADVVGARQMVIIRDIGDVDGTEGPGDNDLGDEIPIMEKILKTAGIDVALEDMDVPITTAFTGAMNYFMENLTTAGGNPTNAGQSLSALSVGINTYDELIALYGKQWEGGVLWRDKWFYNEDWETDEDYGNMDDIDLEAEDKWDGFGPMFADPRDRRELVDQMGAIKRDFRDDLLAMRVQIQKTYMEFFNTSLLHGETPGYDPGVYYGPGLPYNFTSSALATVYNDTNTLLNNTAEFTGLLGLIGVPGAAPLNWTLAGGPDLVATGGDWVFTTFMFLETALATMYYSTDAMPFDQKAEFFLALAVASNMPIQVPSADYVARMMKEFRFDEDAETLYRMPWVSTGVDVNGDGAISPMAWDAKNLYGAPMGGEWYFVEAYLDFDLEGQVLTVEVEYQDDQPDPKDFLMGDSDPDELDDFEFVITFSDPGGCGCAWTSGDTILWQTGAVDQIPGYEITILLGVSGISVLALVYVIMKKRRK